MDLLIELLILLVRWLFRQLTKTPDRGAPGEPTRPPQTPRQSPSVSRQPAVAQNMVSTEPLRARATTLLKRVEGLLRTATDTRHASRLLRAVRIELLEPLSRYLETMPRTSDRPLFLRADQQLRRLEEMFPFYKVLVEDRLGMHAVTLAEADQVLDGFYQEVIAFAASEELPLHSTVPVACLTDSMVRAERRFSGSMLAPVSIPESFSSDVFEWWRLAYGVGLDLFHSLRGFETELRGRLSLEARVPLPYGPLPTLRAHYLILGAWLEDLVAHSIGTLVMGPAYGEAMLRSRIAGSPAEHSLLAATRGNELESIAPDHVSTLVCTQVLHLLGQHHLADDLLARWDAAHPKGPRVWIPLSGHHQAVPMHDDALAESVRVLVEAVLTVQMNSLNQARLLDIPGLAYFHGEHAHVTRLMPKMHVGVVAGENARFVISAAVLASAQDPAQAKRILSHLRGSFLGVAWTDPWQSEPEVSVHAPAHETLARSFFSRTALLEAILVGAALSPPRHHRRRHRLRP